MGSIRVGSKRVWRGRSERGGSGEWERESVGCDSGEVERERVGVKVWSVKLEGEIVGIVRVGEVGGGG